MHGLEKYTTSLLQTSIIYPPLRQDFISTTKLINYYYDDIQWISLTSKLFLQSIGFSWSKTISAAIDSLRIFRYRFLRSFANPASSMKPTQLYVYNTNDQHRCANLRPATGLGYELTFAFQNLKLFRHKTIVSKHTFPSSPVCLISSDLSSIRSALNTSHPTFLIHLSVHCL